MAAPLLSGIENLDSAGYSVRVADEVPEFDEAWMPAEEPATIADIALTVPLLNYARRRWPDASEKMQHYRVRQAIWAKFKHRQEHPDGSGRKLLGGPQPGSGRKPTKAIGAALVEAAEQRHKEIVDAAFSALSPDNDPAVRHKAAMNIAKHAREEAREAREADDYARKTDDEIRRETARMFAEMIANGELSVDDIIDGTASEIVDDQKQLAS